MYPVDKQASPIHLPINTSARRMGRARIPSAMPDSSSPAIVGVATNDIPRAPTKLCAKSNEREELRRGKVGISGAQIGTEGVYCRQPHEAPGGEADYDDRESCQRPDDFPAACLDQRESSEHQDVAHSRSSSSRRANSSSRLSLRLTRPGSTETTLAPAATNRFTTPGTRLTSSEGTISS